MDETIYLWELEEHFRNRNKEVSIDKFIDDLNSFLDEFYNDLLKEEVIHLQEEDFVKCFRYMKNMLKKMASDCDNKFLLYFKEKFYEFVGPIYNPFRWYGIDYQKSIEGNSYTGYYLILYTVLKAYEYQKGDFENFKAIVDDIENLSPKGISKLDDFVLYFSKRKDIVDYIVCNDDYFKDDRFRNFIKAFIEYPGEDSVKELIRFLNNEISFVKSFEGIERLNNGLRDLVKKAIDKTDVSYGAAPIDFEYCLNYSRILLVRDRFSYFYNKMYGFENNSYFKEQILSYVRKFTYGLFEELNTGNDKDSFKKCMDMVFDSDSYFELFEKLIDLDRACSLYDSGDIKEAYEIIKDFGSDKYKAIYCGKKVMYPSIMNKVDKPDFVIDRMMDLYSKIDNSISYDFMAELYFNSKDVELFQKKLDSVIKQKKSFWGRNKTKFKVYLKEKKGR